jgi:hypothetical protein
MARRKRGHKTSPFKQYTTRRSKSIASDANKKIVIEQSSEEELEDDRDELDESGGERVLEVSQRVRTPCLPPLTKF